MQFGSAGGGPGRPDRAPLPPRPPAKPAKPAPPPPPLSKAALSGSVPLRTFGQLKQLWQARTTEEIAADEAAAGLIPPPAATEGPDQDEPSPDPQPISDQSSN